MSGVEHQATVDNKPGLKMKIKRKNLGSKAVDSKHEIVKNSGKQNNMDLQEKGKVGTQEKGKGKGAGKKERKDKNKTNNEESTNGGPFLVPGVPASSNGNTNSTSTNNTNGAGHNSTMGNVSVELDRITPPFTIKKELVHDPYEFDTKIEDGVSAMPMAKKIKTEKSEPSQGGTTMSPATHDVGTETSSVGVITDPDCLGPCEPGTSVTLEGIVWQETENGVLVVNVTWRGKTYVGTLLDATKHDWAPPRLACDSPTSDSESKGAKGRGKRRVTNNSNVTNEVGEGRRLRGGKGGRRNNAAPPSPKNEGAAGGKRKGRSSDLEPSDGPSVAKRKRSNSSSRNTPPTVETPQLIECPEPNCNKKYRHMNGLKYHQSHAHGQHSKNNGNTEENMDTDKEANCDDNNSDTKSDKSESSDTKVKGKEGKKKKSKKNNSETSSKTKDKTDTVLLSANDKNTKKSESKSATNALSEDTANSKTSDKKKGLPCDKATDKSVPSSSANNEGRANNSYLISGAPLSALSAMTASANHIAGSIVSPSHQIKVTNAVIPLGQVEDKKKSKNEKQDKNKSKISGPKLIIPSPNFHQVTVAPSTLASGQISQPSPPGAQLKPIQPKPTILGETLSVNPSLVDLKDSKKQKKKKNKDKYETDKPKSETTSVIKTGPIVSVPTLQEVNKMLAQKQQQKEQQAAQHAKEKMPSPRKIDQSKLLQPPTTLSLHSPTKAGSDKVEAHSPAYSDISDAAEGVPNMENDGEGKDRTPTRDGHRIKFPTDGKVLPHGGTNFGRYYYGQSPYMVSPLPHHSVSPKDKNKSPDSNKHEASKSEKDGEKLKSEGDEKSKQDYHMQHQKLLQMYSPYNSYMSAYGYPDTAYHMRLLQTDPRYREQYEKAMIEQEKRRKEQASRDGERGSSVERQNGLTSPGQGKGGDWDKPVSPNGTHLPALVSDKMKCEKRDLDNKQTESHQILKENLEMKNLMERNAKQESNNPSSVHDNRQREEMRMYMYRQQKLMEQQRLEDERRRKMEQGKRVETKTSMADKVKNSKVTDIPGSEFDRKDSDNHRPGSRPHSRDRLASPSPRDLSKSKTEGGTMTVNPSSSPFPSSQGQFFSSSSSSGFYASQFDPKHPMYRGVNPVIGYSSYLHPSQLPYGAGGRGLDMTDKDKPAALSSPRSGTSSPPTDKPLDLHVGSYYNQNSNHKIHELTEVGKKGERPNSPSPAKGLETPSPDGKTPGTKTKSPPPQRHLHTHHHTHVVGPGYPMYDPYGAAIMASTASVGSFVPK